MNEATNSASGLIRMVRSHGSVCWEELDGECFELCQQDSDYECREFYTAPPAAAVVMPADSDERGSDGEPTYEAKAWNAALDEVARLNACHLRGCSEMIAPFDLQEFARVAALEMEKHDFHGFEPVVLSVVEGLLSAAPEPVEQSAMVVQEGWWQIIHDTLRNYRMSTLDDGHGDGYPLIDAMTADGQSVAGGIEECTYLADAIWNGLLAAAPTPEPASPWISVEDRLPELDTPVWLYDEEVGTFFGMRDSSTDGWSWVEGLGLALLSTGPGFAQINHTDYEPTLWTPLPSTPEQPAKEVQS